jgi:hypothetical protein
MPASTPSQARNAEGVVRAVIARLARPDGEGGVVIERAAIVAEGQPAEAIEAWIVAHGGEPELPLIRTARLGLHGRENGISGGAFAVRPPRRYVLPITALEVRP